MTDTGLSIRERIRPSTAFISPAASRSRSSIDGAGDGVCLLTTAVALKGAP
jgi:hypothetical protein